MSIVDIVGLIASLASLILAVVAIWISMHFYRQSEQVLIQILTSSKTSEVHSKDVSKELINIIREQIKPGVMKIAREEFESIANDPSFVKEVDKGKKDEWINQKKASLLYQLQQVFESIHETPIKTKNIIQDQPQDYGNHVELAVFIKKIKTMESSHRFLAVKFLKDTKFAGNNFAVKMLQYCIDKNILLTYRHPNPKKPDFPVLAVKLNPVHPKVVQALDK
jgi:hypothetical protein